MELIQVKKYFTNYITGLYLVIALVLLGFGCSNGEEIIIHYKFKGFEVSRFDIDNKSYFFYGHCISGKKIEREASLMLDWQVDGFLQAFVIFHEDGSVEMMKNGVGEFNLLKASGRIFFKEYESPEYNNITQKYFHPNRFHNLCFISSNLTAESKTNKESGSDVVVKYVTNKEN